MLIYLASQPALFPLNFDISRVWTVNILDPSGSYFKKKKRKENRPQMESLMLSPTHQTKT